VPNHRKSAAAAWLRPILLVSAAQGTDVTKQPTNRRNPACVCLDVFVDATCGLVDAYAWNVEYEAYVTTGHVASCHHRSNAPKAHRALANILNDLYSGSGEADAAA
jgi:hypothetical protein